MELAQTLGRRAKWFEFLQVATQCAEGLVGRYCCSCQNDGRANMPHCILYYIGWGLSCRAEATRNTSTWKNCDSTGSGCCTVILAFSSRFPLSSAAFPIVVYLTLTGPLRIQPWSQDRQNQTKTNRERIRRQKKAGKANIRKRAREVVSKHRRQEGTPNKSKQIKTKISKKQQCEQKQKQKKQTKDYHIIRTSSSTGYAGKAAL